VDTFVTARTLLTNSAGQILIIRRSPSDPFKPGAWDIPGGQVEQNEDVGAGAIREVQEEVGVTLKQPRIVYAVSAPRPQGSGTWVFFTEAVDPLLVQLGNEHDKAAWIDFKDLPHYTDYQILLGMHTYVTEHHLLV
jgi:8-oxo-dGTP pyrophosphatase MutT (NUDIX family)